MDSTVPADRLKLKARLEAWRSTRKYARQPIPDEFRQAAAQPAGASVTEDTTLHLIEDRGSVINNRMGEIFGM